MGVSPCSSYWEREPLVWRDILVVWLIQKAKVADVDTNAGIVLDVLHKEVRVSLPPVAR